jgi:hypothetical protein
MAWSFYAIDATLPPSCVCSMAFRLISTQLGASSLPPLLLYFCSCIISG